MHADVMSGIYMLIPFVIPLKLIILVLLTMQLIETFQIQIYLSRNI